MSSGTCSSRGRLFSARFWFGCLSLVLLLGVATLTAPAQTLSPPDTQQLRMLLLQADSALTTLGNNLATRTTQTADLQASLDKAGKLLTDSQRQIETLRANLTEAGALQVELGRALDRMQTLLDRLKGQYAQLSQSFETYKTEATAQILDYKRERDTWKTVAVVAIVSTVVAGIVAAVR